MIKMVSSKRYSESSLLDLKSSRFGGYETFQVDVQNVSRLKYIWFFKPYFTRKAVPNFVEMFQTHNNISNENLDFQSFCTRLHLITIYSCYVKSLSQSSLDCSRILHNLKVRVSLVIFFFLLKVLQFQWKNATCNI